MFTYITEELFEVVRGLGVDVDCSSIMGYSMGGLGAMNLGIKCPDKYRSISCFAPVCNPVKSR
jgi:S-formylglutathione hydrolase